MTPATKPTRIHRITALSGRVVTTACGETLKLKATENMPEVASGFESQVTCLRCLQVRRDYHGEA